MPWRRSERASGPASAGGERTEGLRSRTRSWLGCVRRLKVRYERRDDSRLAFLRFGCALVTLNQLHPPIRLDAPNPPFGRSRAGCAVRSMGRSTLSTPMRRFLVVLAFALLPACDTPAPAPDDTDDPPTTDSKATPRTFTFERVMTSTDNFGQVVALDLDVTGRSALVAQRSASRFQIWLDSGSGWTPIVETTEYAPTCVALEPNGSRLLVGRSSGRYHIYNADGTSLVNGSTFSIATIPPGQVVSNYDVQQCDWFEGVAHVTLAANDGTKGAILSAAVPANIDNLRQWGQTLSPLKYQNATNSCQQGFAAYALRLNRLTSNLVQMEVGASCGNTSNALSQITANGSIGAYDGWLAYSLGLHSLVAGMGSDAAHLRRPLVFGGYNGKGSTTVYSFDAFASNRSVVTVSGTAGQYGEAEVTGAVEITQAARTADIGADGRLWIGTVNGLFRSKEVVR